MTKFKKIINAIGLPRLIICLFFGGILLLAAVNDLNMTSYIGSILKYWGMWGILVLAMVPSINCGIGPNFGVSLGIVCGLLGSLLAIELDIAGKINASVPGLGPWVSILFAIAFSVVVAWFVGVAYGKLLNCVKGSEMTVTTYVGYSIIYLMCILWFRAPFSSGEIKWPLGGIGVRNQVSMESSFGSLLNNAGGFYIGGEEGIFVPTGILVFFFLCCFAMYIFNQSKTGKAISAVGVNPQFARASGINVDKMRIYGISISTVLGAVGIIIYTQGFGFLQAYAAPLAMGFQCVAAVLIGGATTGRAKISHVILGTFLFQGLLIMTPPVSNHLLAGTDISDTMRQIIQNGVILYALTKAKGGASSDE